MTDGCWEKGNLLFKGAVPGRSTTVECVYKSVRGQLQLELMGYQKPKPPQNWGGERVTGEIQW